MGDTDQDVCEDCGARAGEFLDPLADPEFCECCEQVLCERCWTEQHVVFMR